MTTGDLTGPSDKIDGVLPRPTHPPSTPLVDVVAWVGASGRAARLVVPVGDGATRVQGFTLSSSRVRPGDLFAALPGAHAHGITYAERAVAAGAVALLTDAAGLEGAETSGLRVPVIVVERPREVLGLVAAGVYDRPAAAMRTIGVTGTQGKTTTTRLAETGLSAAGVRAGVVGTVGTRIAGREVKTALTTPEAPDLHGLFALMREDGVRACAMEVSSHALVLGRVDGVVFDVAVFLNLGRDHLDFHGTLEDYYAAKASLFTPARARRALVNLDDEHGRRLAAETELPLRTFALDDDSADWRAVDVVLEPSGSTFTVIGPDGTRFPGGVPLPGAFNVSNALAAVAAVGEAGYDAEVVAAAAAGVAVGGGVPGRFERIEAGQDFLVIVDFAHKPDAVEAAVRTLRPLAGGDGAHAGRVIVLLGAGGDRDAGKRPIMAGIAARLADVLVITDDNPRTEDPDAIRAAMLAGVEAEPLEALELELLEIGDRRAAIRAAIAAARPGDVVLLAGKGHETGQEIGGVVHPFDDRIVAREALHDLLGPHGPDGPRDPDDLHDLHDPGDLPSGAHP